MDISQMSEEEQLRAAMELSLQGMRSSDQSVGGALSQGQGPQHPKLTLPERGGRGYPLKDQQDVLPPLSRPSAKKLRGEPKAVNEGVDISPDQVSDVLRLLFGSAPESSDLERWLSAGFEFCEQTVLGWGLHQRQGGPCGVLAPVQGFIMKQLLFSDGALQQRDGQPMSVASATSDDSGTGLQSAVLANALAAILFNATPRSSYYICQLREADNQGASGDAQSLKGLSVSGVRVKRIAEAQSVLEDAHDVWLSRRCGVLSFLCSVLLTRTLESVKEDMDDPETPLIGRFGHCSQELVNLMLLGEATSNVFDGSRWLGDDPSSGLMLKGVDAERLGVPTIGLLSELEAMRYLLVGTLYKNPEFPIWVLGSPTHYTLLFSTKKEDCQLSREAEVEQKAKKVFVESAIDEGGLAMAGNLAKMLTGVGAGADRLSDAQTALVREDVILWEDFRMWVLRQYGLGDATAMQPTGRLQLYLYDGQDPPGPTLRPIGMEMSDIDPSIGRGDGDAFSATLQTRWPNAIVTVQPSTGGH